MGSFYGGQISSKLSHWKHLTTDKSILQIVEGDIFDFIDEVPVKHFATNQSFTDQETSFIDEEISKLFLKGVIKPCHHEPVEFVSPIFTVGKSDGGIRMILNLKKLNSYIQYEHFKMDNIYSILNLIT